MWPWIIGAIVGYEVLKNIPNGAPAGTSAAGQGTGASATPGVNGAVAFTPTNSLPYKDCNGNPSAYPGYCANPVQPQYPTIGGGAILPGPAIQAPVSQLIRAGIFTYAPAGPVANYHRVGLF